MSAAIPFVQAGRIPNPGDNVAIATRKLLAGTTIEYEGQTFVLRHTILEGHRYALFPIKKGDELLSWGLPFGIAITDIAPGQYLCNEKILRALAGRKVDFTLPRTANFKDHIKRYELDEATFKPGRQVAPLDQPGFFNGYQRGNGRGVGTRNFVVILATTSPASGYARALADELVEDAARFPEIDGVVAVTHTEGGGRTKPNNFDYVMRTLAGFMVHPNVGAILAVDHPGGGYGNADLAQFIAEHQYPIESVPHYFTEVDGPVQATLARDAARVRAWLPEVGALKRTPQPLSNLKLALQCGGSDAFSGVSGNALAGWVAKRLLTEGGSANLAETDELIGAEPYVLSNVRDFTTAKAFLDKIENFKRYAANHGTTAEGNPSGGNNYRGLYNIALKSIGAARKKDPEVRLDHVIDYGQPMHEPGYYFMDSPGNDLESIAGQVAAGSNLVIFITGNGSITNFPFVPTLKFVTTTGRFELLAEEMDVNAGRYNDGLPMDQLGEETFQLTVEIASGKRSKGELAGHSQVSLWRDWPQTDPHQIEIIRATPKPNGVPLPVATGDPVEINFTAYPAGVRYGLDQVGLVMPTSLCSGQPARVIAEHLNRTRTADDPVSHYVALVHTEGCGSNNSAPILLQTMLGYLAHANVRHAVLLEHGCEQTHNDTVRQYLEHRGVGPERFGWASVQLDGGLAKVTDLVAAQFRDAAHAERPREPVAVGAEALSLGLGSTGPIDDDTAQLFGDLARGIVAAGGTVVIPANATLLASSALREVLLQDRAHVAPSLAYGQSAERAGLHVMETPSENHTEVLTGLGATGVGLMLYHIGELPIQGHPMVPVAQVTASPEVGSRFGHDLDLVFGAANPGQGLPALRSLLSNVASREYVPHQNERGLTEFQLTRGRLGLSM